MRGRRPRRECQFESGLVLQVNINPVKYLAWRGCCVYISPTYSSPTISPCAFSIFVLRSFHSLHATEIRLSRCILPDIAMVQATHARHPDDFRIRLRLSLNRATVRRILNHSVNALGVVVADIVAKQPPQVVLIEHDHMIEDLAPARSYPALCCSVLPRTPERRSLGSDPERPDGSRHLVGKNRVVVIDKEAGS